MDIGLIILIVLLAAGFGYYFYTKKKRKPVEQKEVLGFQEYHLKVANLTAKGMEENRDFVTAIIGLPEFKSKTPEQIKEWIKGKVGEEGTLSPYNVELGLQELTYTTIDKIYDVFFLLVEETGQNVIDWGEPKPVPPPPNPPKKYFEVDYSPDVKDDQTAYILEQFASFGNGSSATSPKEIVFAKGGRIRTDEAALKSSIFKIENKKHWEIYGSETGRTIFYTTKPAVAYGGSVNKGTYSHRRHFFFVDCEDIKMRFIDVEGSNNIRGKLLGTAPEFTPDWYGYEENGIWIIGKPDHGAVNNAPGYQDYLEQEHAFDLRGSKDFILEDCNVSGVWGDGVYLGAGSSGPARNITLRNLKLTDTGRQGIAAANNVDGLIIDGIETITPRRAKIDLEPHSPSGYVRNVVIKNCKLHGGMTTLAAYGNGDVSHIIYENNEHSYGSFIRCGDSRELTRRKDWKIIDNVNTGAYGSPSAAMVFKMTDDVIISGNTEKIVSSQGQNIISFDRCGGNLEVTGNDFGYGKYIHVNNDAKIVSHSNNNELEIIR